MNLPRKAIPLIESAVRDLRRLEAVIEHDNQVVFLAMSHRSACARLEKMFHDLAACANAAANPKGAK